MTNEALRDFFNSNFISDGDKPKVAHFSISVQMMDNGQTISLPAVKTTASSTLYEIFQAVNDWMKTNSPLQPINEPGPAPGPVNTVVDLVEITHNKQTYFIEVHSTGKIIIQDEKRTILESGSAYNGVLKKYNALQQTKEK